MRYNNTVKGRFVSRLNRFIANVEIDGRVCVCHVKNTGRCRELLTEDAVVVLEVSDNPARKTAYDLVAVYKGDMLINMDSQAPNRALGEWITAGGFENVTLVRPECKYGSSRFDFYVEAGGRRIFAEVKGVTLEVDGVVMFPDAPTERGVKHLRELSDAAQNGYDTYVFFVVQMEKCKYFTPNVNTHPEFAQALREAQRDGVRVRALNCKVTENTLTINGDVEVVL
ncbi:MAG: DNA/RNA nuclease SfsA [Clostridia bacterium]|nr:DNA/RNA nuclease SfsA [Clostridia bacterium]